MGGVEPAKTYITEALKAGKAVVTANKELIAKEGHELLTLATEVGQDLYFEASVAGGIPIIKDSQGVPHWNSLYPAFLGSSTAPPITFSPK